MALPKIDAPVYEVELPLSKKKLRYRPFLVKEQRNLLMAMESKEYDTIEKNIKQVLHNCTLTENINFDDLPVVDIEFFFLQLRAKSVGEVTENKYICNNVVDGIECGNTMEVNINLLEIEVEKDDSVSDTIKLNSQYTIKMNYPKFSIVNRAGSIENINDFAFEMIADSIEYIHDGEQFYYGKDATKQELIDFVEQLNQEQFSKLEEFFSNLPKLKKVFDVTCSKCKHNHHIEVEGLESFFG
ncbi:Baseplate hub assembly protein, bacteriophage T4-like [uncultured Caudovirales phage]|jgi:hypothetical protein|uniref:Baseplate hub assembly protein, bacteriophage T4-like n=1 Tax=uncultured Caudovirales phage TaxID=2100421 RepID=A0A6J5T569_9CAUD|nr:Baseplate hub assembly protein, bacteriophage T4-like [uncultured Caudovirales phage]